MQAELAILVPVLGRPWRAQPLLDSISQVSRHPVRVLFLCSPDDTEEIAACKATGADVLVVPFRQGKGDWAKKLEHGRANTTEPYMLLAADDLLFHPRWDSAVLDVFNRIDCGVVGTNDLGNELVKRGLHSTHPVVCRGYADAYGTIDQPELMLHQGYTHQYADNELVETAISRGCWQFARLAVIEHLHPAWGKAEVDATYQLANAHAERDHRLFHWRRRLWQKPGRGRLLPRARMRQA